MYIIPYEGKLSQIYTAYEFIEFVSWVYVFKIHVLYYSQEITEAAVGGSCQVMMSQKAETIYCVPQELQQQYWDFSEK